MTNKFIFLICRWIYERLSVIIPCGNIENNKNHFRPNLINPYFPKPDCSSPWAQQQQGLIIKSSLYTLDRKNIKVVQLLWHPVKHAGTIHNKPKKMWLNKSELFPFAGVCWKQKWRKQREHKKTFLRIFSWMGKPAWVVPGAKQKLETTDRGTKAWVEQRLFVSERKGFWFFLTVVVAMAQV